MGRAIFLQTPEKLAKQSLTEFLKQYNYYINRLLIARSDPFIAKQSQCYLRNIEVDKLSKLGSVFNRL